MKSPWVLILITVALLTSTSAAQDPEREAYVPVSAQASASTPAAVPLQRGWYRITASGEWSYSRGRWHGPSGDPNKTGGTRINRNARYCQLLVYSNGQWYPYHEGMLIYHGGGNLHFACNDSKHNDNQGSLLVTITW